MATIAELAKNEYFHRLAEGYSFYQENARWWNGLTVVPTEIVDDLLRVGAATVNTNGRIGLSEAARDYADAVLAYAMETYYLRCPFTADGLEIRSLYGWNAVHFEQRRRRQQQQAMTWAIIDWKHGDFNPDIAERLLVEELEDSVFTQEVFDALHRACVKNGIACQRKQVFMFPSPIFPLPDGKYFESDAHVHWRGAGWYGGVQVSGYGYQYVEMHKTTRFSEPGLGTAWWYDGVTPHIQYERVLHIHPDQTPTPDPRDENVR